MGTVDRMRKVDRAAVGMCRSPLGGPETAAEWVRRQGHLSLVARRDRWAAESGVLRASAACYEHGITSRCAQRMRSSQASSAGWMLKAAAALRDGRERWPCEPVGRVPERVLSALCDGR